MDESVVKHLPKVDHTPSELDDASKRLLGAADRLERDGWFQMTLGNPLVGHCVLLAIYRDTVGAPVSFDCVKDEAALRLRKYLGLRGAPALSLWNDAPGRTKDEVIAKLRAVALGG